MGIRRFWVEKVQAHGDYWVEKEYCGVGVFVCPEQAIEECAEVASRCLPFQGWVVVFVTYAVVYHYVDSVSDLQSEAQCGDEYDDHAKFPSVPGQSSEDCHGDPE